jgi:hypothetical protein
VPAGKHLRVHKATGTRRQPHEGPVNRDILRIEARARCRYLRTKSRRCTAQGVKINDKHIGGSCAMLQKVRLWSPATMSSKRERGQAHQQEMNERW